MTTHDSPDSFRHGWLFGAVWLVYLGSPLEAALDRDGARRVVGVAATAAFALAYLVLLAHGRRRRIRRGPETRWAWARWSLLVALELVMTAGAGDHALAAGVFISAYGMFTFPARQAWTLTGLIAVGSAVAAHTVPGWQDHGDAFAAVLSAVAVFAIRLAFQRNERLVETQEEMAALAVSEERSRFARDLHDILGHSLTVIAIKAELAGRLVHLDPARAEDEIHDLERLAREALADVRGAVTGYREITLSRELVTARAALTVAGISSDLPTAVDHVPGELRELFGWAVREGVTNVVRHSRAGTCTVRVSAHCLEVLDDGVGSLDSPCGNGLTGLQERATAFGGHVERTATAAGHRLAVVTPAQVRA